MERSKSSHVSWYGDALFIVGGLRLIRDITVRGDVCCACGV